VILVPHLAMHTRYTAVERPVLDAVTIGPNK